MQSVVSRTCVTMQNDKEIIKIAIKVSNETHLHDLPKTHTLQDFINDVCQEHEVCQKTNVI